MSELLARLQGDLNSARKSQDKAGTLLLGTVLSEIKNKKIELRRDPTDADIIDVLRKSIKRRRESVEMYTKGNRSDLADKESAEAAALEKYIPAQVSDDELRAEGRAQLHEFARAERHRVCAHARAHIGASNVSAWRRACARTAASDRSRRDRARARPGGRRPLAHFWRQAMAVAGRSRCEIGTDATSCRRSIARRPGSP